MNKLAAALEAERPLQIAGAINAYAALLAEDAGFRALYLSGAGVANASFGLPDLAMTTLSEVATEARRITAATDLPLLVDVDTGFGDGLAIDRTVREMTAAGVAGIHLEDQVAAKRCGHRFGKALVSEQEMADRISAAVAARGSGDLLIMARTDALAVEGLAAAVQRSAAYAAAGADAIFFEAATALDHYQRAADAAGVPILANMTEFGVSPLFTLDQLAAHGVAMVLYPLTAFRAMSSAAQRVYRVLRAQGGQHEVVAELQTRKELYRVLNYAAYEQRMDRLLARRRNGPPPTGNALPAANKQDGTG
jgi:methylisocitrate lyase